MLRLFGIGVIAVVLFIPIGLIFVLISERQARRQEAIDEVSAKWGNRQAIVGPALIVPFTYRWTDATSKGDSVTHAELRQAVFLPRQLQATGRLDSQIRSRGIFSVPVYTLELKMTGVFDQVSFHDLGVEPAAVHWDRAHVAVGIADVRAILKETSIVWNGQPSPFVPSTGGFTDYGAGIHAAVAADAATASYAFTFPISLNGSVGLSVAPFARETAVELSSNSANPSFQGNWLPVDRNVTDAGFTAKWSVPALGRNYPQAWTSASRMHDAIEKSQFGVDLIDPVDQYRMAERSAKYGVLFIALTFGAVWLIEVLAGVRAHPIQYILLGAALVVFYLLELSLSEHLGFGAAYAVASVAVIVQIAAYSLVILRRMSLALIVAGAVASLYVCLFVLLKNEDYALLIGSIGLFVILSLVMFVTRRVNWYALGANRSGASAT